MHTMTRHQKGSSKDNILYTYVVIGHGRLTYLKYYRSYCLLFLWFAFSVSACIYCYLFFGIKLRFRIFHRLQLFGRDFRSDLKNVTALRFAKDGKVNYFSWVYHVTTKCFTFYWFLFTWTTAFSPLVYCHILFSYNSTDAFA